MKFGMGVVLHKKKKLGQNVDPIGSFLREASGVFGFFFVIAYLLTDLNEIWHGGSVLRKNQFGQNVDRSDPSFGSLQVFSCLYMRGIPNF